LDTVDMNSNKLARYSCVQCPKIGPTVSMD
jgi:hypothetical protein